MNRNLGSLLTDFSSEKITKGSHLEKLCLIDDRVGRDLISDFVTNLIKGYLLRYTQTFAREHLTQEQRRVVVIDKVRFCTENSATMSSKRRRPKAPSWRNTSSSKLILVASLLTAAFADTRQSSTSSGRSGRPSHGLRGTHASLAMTAGATGDLVAAPLGHESFTTAERHYARPEAIAAGQQSGALRELEKSSREFPRAA